jgi:hypothetical protein
MFDRYDSPVFFLSAFSNAQGDLIFPRAPARQQRLLAKWRASQYFRLYLFLSHPPPPKKIPPSTQELFHFIDPTACACVRACAAPIQPALLDCRPADVLAPAGPSSQTLLFQPRAPPSGRDGCVSRGGAGWGGEQARWGGRTMGCVPLLL